MAAKKSAKANGAATTKSLGPAPKGYTKVETRLQGFWKPKKEGDWIEGVVGHRIESPGADGKPNVYFTFRLATDECTTIFTSDEKKVEAEGGMLVGIGGKTLATFLEAHEGKMVYLRYVGLGVAKKGQNAPKLYETFARDGSE